MWKTEEEKRLERELEKAKRELDKNPGSWGLQGNVMQIESSLRRVRGDTSKDKR